MQCRDERSWLWCRGEEEAEVVGDGLFILAAGAFARKNLQLPKRSIRRKGKESGRIGEQFAGERA